MTDWQAAACGLPFSLALRGGLVGRLESSAYTRWVKTLPCCCGCERPADDPHHPKLRGFAVAGSKVPDWWTIPLSRACHDRLHHDVQAWEAAHGAQSFHALMTLTQAIVEGVITCK